MTYDEFEKENNSYDDICYECKGCGDDYYVDESGDLICYCIECPFFEYDLKDD
jgi:hypothetical protein